MPINVFGDSSHPHDKKIDTSFFVQKRYLRFDYIESKIEEDNAFKKSISIQEAALERYVDNKFNDPSIIKNTAHVDFNVENLNNVHSVKVNSFPTLEEHLTPKLYVDNVIRNSVDESILLRLDPEEKLKLDEQDSLVPNSTLTLPKTIIAILTKTYVDYKFDGPRIIKNTTHVDFNHKNFDNIRFVKVNSMPAVREQLTPKFYIKLFL